MPRARIRSTAAVPCATCGLPELRARAAVSRPRRHGWSSSQGTALTPHRCSPSKEESSEFAAALLRLSNLSIVAVDGAKSAAHPRVAETCGELGVSAEKDDHQRSRLTAPFHGSSSAPAQRGGRDLLRSRDAHFDAVRCRLAMRGLRGTAGAPRSRGTSSAQREHARGEEQVDAHLPSIDRLLKPVDARGPRVLRGSAYGTVLGPCGLPRA